MVSHVNEKVLRMTANYYGWKVNGQLNKREDCFKGKAKQKGN